MQLHPTLDAFYQSMLGYAGMRYDEGIIKSNNEAIGDIRIDDKPLTLPYHDNLKNPDNRHIFHPLNESYTTPETVFIAAYKKRMTLEINLKVYAAIDSMMRLGIDVAIQKKVKSPKLLDMVQRIGEVDLTSRESLTSIIKHSQKVNEEAFIVDFHVKKNGQIKEVPYAAIGKVNFILFNELRRALDDNSDGYRVFGAKVRKKDILTLINVLHVIFSQIDEPEEYTCGTDIKSFRFLNALLLSTYPVTSTVNGVAELLKALKEPSLEVEEMVSDLKWAETLEELYSITNEIRAIPNQTSVAVESNALKLKEPAQVPTQTQHSQAPIPPSFNPSQIPVTQTPHQQQQPSPQQPYPQQPYPQQGYPQAPMPQQPMQGPPKERSVEDIISQSVQQQVMYPNHQFMPAGYPQQPAYQQPMYQQPMPQQPYYQPQPQPQQPYPSGPYYPNQPPQGFPPPNQPYPQHHQQGYPGQPPQGYPGQVPYQGGIQINPQLFNR